MRLSIDQHQRACAAFEELNIKNPGASTDTRTPRTREPAKRDPPWEPTPSEKLCAVHKKKRAAKELQWDPVAKYYVCRSTAVCHVGDVPHTPPPPPPPRLRTIIRVMARVAVMIRAVAQAKKRAVALAKVMAVPRVVRETNPLVCIAKKL